MKKIAALIMCVIICFSLTSCSLLPLFILVSPNDGDTDASSSSSSSSSSSEVQEGSEYADMYERVDSNGNKDANGKFLSFAKYPKTRVTDSALISALGNLAGELPMNLFHESWTSYKYYMNSSDIDDFMWYIDIDYMGDTYRGVYFTTTRPSHTDSGDFSSHQSTNGYEMFTVYWFKWEPIIWRILAEGSGFALLHSNLVIDSQPCQSSCAMDRIDNEYYISNNNRWVQDAHGDKIYACDYEHSSSRAWLLGGFYNDAFKGVPAEMLISTELSDSGTLSSNPYIGASTTDKVFLLSESEALTYYSSSSDRQKRSTDYALCQGAYCSRLSGSVGNTYWWLRTPSTRGSYYACCVQPDGTFGFDSVSATDQGIVPAVWIKL